MKHYLVTIETSYSTEDYLIPVLDGESIDNATEKALSDITFCEDYKIIGCRKSRTKLFKGCIACTKGLFKFNK